MDNITKSKDRANGYIGVSATGSVYLIDKTSSKYQSWVAINRADGSDTFNSSSLRLISESLRRM